jgi:hypothetical protein
MTILKELFFLYYKYPWKFFLNCEGVRTLLQSLFTIGLGMYCKFCKSEMRSKTPEHPDGPEVPGPTTLMKHLKRFHVKTQSQLKRPPSNIGTVKSPSNSGVVNIFAKSKQAISPEYKYKDLTYHHDGRTAQNWDTSDHRQGRHFLVHKNKGGSKYCYISTGVS